MTLPLGSLTVPDSLPFAAPNAESAQQNKLKMLQILRIGPSALALLSRNFTDWLLLQPGVE